MRQDVGERPITNLYQITDKDLLWPYLRDDTSRQTYALREAIVLVETICQSLPEGQKINVLDLGCGDGSSYERFAKLGPKISWLGLDIEDSPEVRTRVRKDIPFATYDGVNIPAPVSSFDLVFSHQVLEHVVQPGPLLNDVHRVLKDGGILVGSTSQLEPYHSRSIWNFTPYGLVVLLREAGFDEIQLMPGTDGLTLFVRRLLGMFKVGFGGRFFFEHESPLNLLIELVGKLMSLKRRSFIKLVLSGHFVFIAKKTFRTKAHE